MTLRLLDSHQSSRQDFFIRFLPFRWINVISRTTKSTLMNLAQCGIISRKCFLISSLLRDLIPSWRLLSCFAFRVYRALFKAHKKKQHKKRNECISITFRSFRTKYAGYRAHKRECLEDRKREICVFILSLVVIVTFFLGLGSAILLWKLIKSLNGPYLLMEHRHFMFFGTL